MADEEDGGLRRRRARDDRDLRADADGTAALGFQPRATSTASPPARRRRRPGCPVKSPFSCVAVRRGSAGRVRLQRGAQRLPEAPRPSRAAPARPYASRSASWVGRSACCTPPAPTARRRRARQIAQLTTLAGQAGARIGTVRAFEKTQLQASTDGLTGLVNRRTLESELRGAVQERPAVRARDRRPRPLQAAQRHARPRGRRPRAAPVRAGRPGGAARRGLDRAAGAARSS